MLVGHLMHVLSKNTVWLIMSRLVSYDYYSNGNTHKKPVINSTRMVAQSQTYKQHVVTPSELANIHIQSVHHTVPFLLTNKKLNAISVTNKPALSADMVMLLLKL